MSYDEAVLRSRLAKLDRFRKAAFAAACAERLWPLFERYSRATGQDAAKALRAVLDEVWIGSQGARVLGLTAARDLAESMVPSEDGEWLLETGYGQNAAAAVAYAVRTLLTEDPQEAVWAARQVYEAADYGAQRSSSNVDAYPSEDERMLVQSFGIQGALEGIAKDLTEVEVSNGKHWASLRGRARREGEIWAGSLA